MNEIAICEVSGFFSFWSVTSSGECSICSAYAVVRGKENHVPRRNIVWSHAILPKHAFILWLMYMGGLNTRAFLLLREKRGMPRRCRGRSRSSRAFQAFRGIVHSWAEISAPMKVQNMYEREGEGET